MALPTYTYQDMDWAKRVAVFAKYELYGIGKPVILWPLLFETMVVEAKANVNNCVSNVITCNS